RRPERRLCRRPGTWSHVVADVGVRLGSVATRNRDVELGVAPHAVLGHVEAARLGFLLDADAPQLLQRPEDPEGGAERPHADGGKTEGLDAELVEASRIDEAARSGREGL